MFDGLLIIFLVFLCFLMIAALGFYSVPIFIAFIVWFWWIEKKASKEAEEKMIMEKTLEQIEDEFRKKQEENKPFISGTITHIGNDGKETRLGNITIHLKE
ncbi:hypothetical protein [Haemophilus haemolyticus]|uniref:hypothetical protein n=1 Tax=Haemophilus haemolyticus TaxID=726 RepID=UPI000E5904EB|nr:hypothetical protein [Haemophilus haemolyticus]